MGDDRFINNLNKSDYSEDNSENFFLQPENISPTSVKSFRHINDYDCNILQKEAYKDVKSEVFRLEYKIAAVEEELKNIESQIKTANEIHDFEQSELLFNRYKQLKYELEDLMLLYNETSLSAKITGEITGMFSLKIKSCFKGVSKFLDMLETLIISKLPHKISSAIELKKSLEKLENINKSVDELIKLQTPLGEAGDKYIQLSKYITKANSIHAEIYRNIKH